MIKDLAPHITRQRMMIEGFFTIAINEDVVKKTLLGLAAALDLRTYGDPIVFSPGGMGKEENAGYDAFVPLIDSGIAGYFWSKDRFFSVVLYTCKSFDTKKAEKFLRDFLEVQNETATLNF
jgi:S-adenosylmethionine decarboxylase